MFVLQVNGESRRIFTKSEITIGSRSPADLEVVHAEPRHARIVIKDARYILVDLRTPAGTYVNDRRITAPLIVRPADRIAIGETTILIVDVAPRHERTRAMFAPEEQALLDEVDDDQARSVYADYLESKGDLARAEIVRRLGVGGKPSLPFLDLLIGTDVDWRMRVLRPAVETCKTERCPGEWGAMARTPDPAVRTCASCRRQVRYAIDVVEARALHAEFVIDPLCLRWAGDIGRR